MLPTYYIPIFIMFIVLFIILRRNKFVALRRIIKNRKTEDRKEMIELAKRFLGKECLISAFDGGHQFEGVIKEVSDGAILIEKNGNLEAINLDFVIRIREYPRNKNGKKALLLPLWRWC